MSNQMSGEVFSEFGNVNQVSSTVNTEIVPEEIEEKIEEYNNLDNRLGFAFNTEDIKKYLSDLNLEKLMKANEANAANAPGKMYEKNFKNRFADLVIKNRLTYRQLLFWLCVGLPPVECMDGLVEVVSNGRFEELLPYFERVDYDYYKIIILLEFRNFSNEQLDFITSIDFGVGQMSVIGVGVEHGLSLEKIKQFANPKYPSKVMNAMRRAVEYNCTSEQLELLADFGIAGWNNYQPEYIAWCIDAFRYAILNYELSLEMAQKMKLLIKLMTFPRKEIQEMIFKVCGKQLPSDEILMK